MKRLPLALSVKRIRAVYDSLPALECKGLCYQSCGPIYMSRVEWERIKKHLGYEPVGVDIVCPMLNRETNRCKVYDIRPLVCRLFGVAEEMPCPFGCVPERVVRRDEGTRILEKVGELGK